MRKSREFISMPVISLDEGQHLGSVKGIVVNPAEKMVSALIIEQKGLFKEQRFIPFPRIKSIGADAITVDRSSGVEKGARLPDILRLLKDRVDIYGARLVAENGAALGFVDDYFVDENSGKIAGLEFAGKFIDSMIRGKAFLDISFVRTIGKEVVIVTAEGAENVLKLDGGLQESVKTLKDSTGQILGNTLLRTKELGSNLNKSLEKMKRDFKGRRDGNGEAVEGVEAEEVKMTGGKAPCADGQAAGLSGPGGTAPCACGEHKTATPPSEGGPSENRP
jgi:uncharacterized protein YrrD